MSRTTDHHVISLFLGPIEEQPDGGFVRAIRWINRHGEESQLDLFAEAGPGCLRLHSEAERRLDAYAAQARESDPLLSPPREPLLSPPRRKPMTDPQDFESQAAYDAACLPETDGTVDLRAEAAPDNAADALRPKPLY